MRKELFLPDVEGEARLLLLINVFFSSGNGLEGRTKLAKLDFFLRYPAFLKRALSIRNPDVTLDIELIETNNIENRMVRYRYGPWDPAYYALLGRLIGKQLIETVHTSRGLSYKVTDRGHELATRLAQDSSWKTIADRAVLLRKHLNLSGSNLKDFIYKYFPEVSHAAWGDHL